MDPNQKREMYLKMFVQEAPSGANFQITTPEDDDLNERETAFTKGPGDTFAYS